MFTKCLKIQYIYDKTDIAVVHKGVFEQAGGAEQHNITDEATNELKLGEGG